MTPLQRYQQDIDNGLIEADQAQYNAVEHLDGIFNELKQPRQPLKTGFFERLLNKKQTLTPVSGLYMWGGVGRGKTYLMDLFYDALPFTEKKRIHFHRFMQSVQDELKHLRDLQNPLEIIAGKFSQRHSHSMPR